MTWAKFHVLASLCKILDILCLTSVCYLVNESLLGIVQKIKCVIFPTSCPAHLFALSERQKNPWKSGLIPPSCTCQVQGFLLEFIPITQSTQIRLKGMCSQGNSIIPITHRQYGKRILRIVTDSTGCSINSVVVCFSVKRLAISLFLHHLLFMIKAYVEKIKLKLDSHQKPHIVS